MNKLLVFVFLLFINPLFLLADNIQIIDENNTSITLRCSIDHFNETVVATPNGSEVIITLDDGTSMLLSGAPDLPKLTTSLIIPNKAHMSVMVESSTFTDYPNVAVAPSKGNLPRNIIPSEIPYSYGTQYGLDEFFPEKRVALRDPYIFRDYRGQTVVINPIAYNPTTNTLRVYHELIIKVVETPGEPINTFSPKHNKVVNQFDKLYGQRFLNYETKKSFYPQLGELGDMLIISAPQYIDQMSTFVEWKNQKGIKTKIVDVNTIGNSVPAIHAYLDNEYATTDLTYLLLVGDEFDVVTDQAFESNACDNCYGYRAGDDHFSELFVGRFNGETQAHIQTMIDRTLEYEINPMEGEWLKTAIGVSSSFGPGDDGEFDYEHINNVKSELLAYTYNDVFEFYDGSHDAISPTPGDPTSDAPADPNSSMIVDVLNTSGASLFNYAGHGNHAVLLSGNFDINAVDGITKTGSYPFMIAVACCAGDFQGDFGAGDCFGDRWIRATDAAGNPTGGIGGCFSSILQTWVPPMEGQDEMIKLITESAQYNIRHTLGGIVVHGCGSMIDDYGMDGEDMMDTWCVFGDPSVVLRTDNPDNIAVTHLPATSIGTTTLSFSSDVAGALVALNYQNKVIGTGIVENGTVTIDFEPVAFPDQILVTATAYNHYPYQGAVDVIATTGPFVVLNNLEVKDLSGNANGAVDFGENIVLDVALKNVGVELASTVNAVLSSDDTQVTFVDANENYGDLSVEQVLLVNNAFNFNVASFAEDQHQLAFNLQLTDAGGNNWLSDFNLTVNAPSLNLGSVVIDDTNDGNGDGRFNNGELVTFTVVSNNNGHADSPAAFGNLLSTSPFLTILSPNIELGVLPKDGGSITANFEIQVADNAPISEEFELIYTTNAGDYSASLVHENAINIIVAEDFETGDFANNWMSEGAASWFVTAANPVAGEYCMQSGIITNNEATEMILTQNVTDDGFIVFSRKVSTEPNFDVLFFFIDNELIAEWSGELDWEVVSFPVTAGQRTFKWVYGKDSFVDLGQDAAWIDEIILSPFEVTVDVETIDPIDFSIDVSPNPFMSNTAITLDLEKSSDLSIHVYNMAGIMVKELLSTENVSKGTHTFELLNHELPQGVYLLNVQLDNQMVSKKLVKQ